MNDHREIYKAAYSKVVQDLRTAQDRRDELNCELLKLANRLEAILLDPDEPLTEEEQKSIPEWIRIARRSPPKRGRPPKSRA
jgi:hypothetical protein